MTTLDVVTARAHQALDITPPVQEAVAATGVREGLCTLHVPHTTAGILVNEHDDPDVMRDLLAHFAELIPRSPRFHHAEGNEFDGPRRRQLWVQVLGDRTAAR